MGFISDRDAVEIAKRFLSEEDFADFDRSRELMRHLDECIATNTPSPHCIHTDPAKNLKWCHIALKIHEMVFEHYMQDIIEHRESTEKHPLKIASDLEKIADRIRKLSPDDIPF